MQISDSFMKSSCALLLSAHGTRALGAHCEDSFAAATRLGEDCRPQRALAPLLSCSAGVDERSHHGFVAERDVNLRERRPVTYPNMFCDSECSFHRTCLGKQSEGCQESPTLGHDLLHTSPTEARPGQQPFPSRRGDQKLKHVETDMGIVALPITSR